MLHLRHLDDIIDSWPLAGRVAVAIFLVVFSCVSVYGRYNVEFGSKAFSHIPKSEIRSNWAHIFRYTIIPVIITLVYLYLWATK